ncbi:hypothetical protein ACMDCR_14345 [Labrys okinawensis]|uniref:hypothetical protein n=1 Tax=Labrys okinawensis TaxID=346911 RepID=UPI0039BC7D9B
MKRMLLIAGLLAIPLAGCADDGYYRNQPYDPYYAEPGYAAPIYYGNSYYYGRGYPQYRYDRDRYPGRPWQGRPRPPVTSPGPVVAPGAGVTPRPRSDYSRPFVNSGPARNGPRYTPGTSPSCPPGTNAC